MYFGFVSDFWCIKFVNVNGIERANVFMTCDLWVTCLTKVFPIQRLWNHIPSFLITFYCFLIHLYVIFIQGMRKKASLVLFCKYSIRLPSFIKKLHFASRHKTPILSYINSYFIYAGIHLWNFYLLPLIDFFFIAFIESARAGAVYKKPYSLSGRGRIGFAVVFFTSDQMTW